VSVRASDRASHAKLYAYYILRVILKTLI